MTVDACNARNESHGLETGVMTTDCEGHHSTQHSIKEAAVFVCESSRRRGESCEGLNVRQPMRWSASRATHDMSIDTVS